jgi:hypothetical protein
MAKPNDGPIEPARELSAQMRAGAKGLRELYVALVREGFTPDEARAFVIDLVKAGRH